MHIAHNKPLYIVDNMNNIQYIVVKFDDKTGFLFGVKNDRILISKEKI